jgi:hypothetical protein
VSDPESIIRVIIELQKQFNVLVQVDVVFDQVTTSSEWERILTPTTGYAETGTLGPFRVADLQAVRINPIERLRVGKHAAVQTLDHTQPIQAALKEHGIDAVIENDGVLTIRVA